MEAKYIPYRKPVMAIIRSVSFLIRKESEFIVLTVLLVQAKKIQMKLLLWEGLVIAPSCPLDL